MSDFYQTGVVATFHKLGRVGIEKIEAELTWYSQERPIALVLPSLYSELEGEALKGIVRELKKVAYVSEIVVALARQLMRSSGAQKNFFPSSLRKLALYGIRVRA